MSKRTKEILDMLSTGASMEDVRKRFGLSSSRLSDIVRTAKSKAKWAEEEAREYPDFVGLSGTVRRALRRVGCKTKEDAKAAFLEGKFKDLPLIGKTRYNEIAAWLGMLPEVKRITCPHCGKEL